MKIRRLILFLLLFIQNLVYAKSLGIIGTAYPIAEPDLLQVIQKKIALQQGVLDQFQTELNQNFQQLMDRPTPVAGLSKTSQSRTWLFDPIVTIPNDLENLFPEHAINPLDTVSLKQALLFYDADDPQQVKWAQNIDMSLKGATHILVGGSVKSQMERLHKSVYFDQGGRLTQRFQLQHVPTIITQQNRSLKIQEVALP